MILVLGFMNSKPMSAQTAVSQMLAFGFSSESLLGIIKALGDKKSLFHLRNFPDYQREHLIPFPDVILAGPFMVKKAIQHLLEEIRQRESDPVVMVVVSEVHCDEAVEYMRQGALDYLPITAISTLADRLPKLLAETRQRQAHRGELKQLRDHERNLRMIFDHAGDAIFLHEPDGNFVEVNQTACKRMGYTKEELCRMAPWDIDVNALAVKQPQRLIEMAEKDQTIFETTHRCKDGTLIPVEVTRRFVDFNGQRLLLSTARDIRARKKAQAALLDSDRRQRAILDNIPDIAWLKDEEGRFLAANETFARVCGHSQEDLIGKTDYGVWPKELAEQYRADDAEVMASGKQKRVEEPLAGPEGRQEWIETIKSPIFNDQGRVIGTTGIARFISDRKRAEEDRHQMEIQLRHAQKMESIGQLASGIAHEINTPTQFIGDNTRFLKDSFAELLGLLQRLLKCYQATLEGAQVSEDLVHCIQRELSNADLDYLGLEIPKAIDQTLDGIQRVAKIVHAMKEFAHPDRGDELAPLDLNKAIQNTLIVARNEWKYFAELKTELDETLPSVQCHPGDINQVLLNLIVNAAQAIEEKESPRGGKGLIVISTGQDQDFVEIRIKDTGAGIPKALQSRIFDPFFTTKQVGKGTGQGLAIAYNIIVLMHKGTIQFESEEGVGTTFIVRLPSHPPGMEGGA